jgi:hypothetical protein
MKREVLAGVIVAFAIFFLFFGWYYDFFKAFTGKVIGVEELGPECLTGTTETIIEDDRPGIAYYFNANGEKYKLVISSEVESIIAQLLSGTQVRVCGLRSKEEIRVSDLRLVGGGDKGRGEPIEDVTGEQRIAFILYNFQNNMSEPVSIAQAEALMEQVNQYYQEISYGKTWLNTSIFGYFTLQTNSYPCSYMMWQNRILENWGVSPLPYPNYIPYWGEYDRIIIASAVDACSWTGSGTVGKAWENTVTGGMWLSTVWLDGPFGISRSTISHELGHNHGVRHSGDLECGNSSYDPMACQSIEYGDAYSVMGRSYLATSLHMDNIHKEMIGWFDEYDVEYVNHDNLGTHALSPIQVNNPYPKATKIPRVNQLGEPDGYYYLEYRRPFGIDEGVNVSLFDGIFVRVDEWAYGSGGGQMFIC